MRTYGWLRRSYILKLHCPVSLHVLPGPTLLASMWKLHSVNGTWLQTKHLQVGVWPLEDQHAVIAHFTPPVYFHSSPACSAAAWCEALFWFFFFRHVTLPAIIQTCNHMCHKLSESSANSSHQTFCCDFVTTRASGRVSFLFSDLCPCVSFQSYPPPLAPKHRPYTCGNGIWWQSSSYFRVATGLLIFSSFFFFSLYLSLSNNAQ